MRKSGASAATPPFADTRMTKYLAKQLEAITGVKTQLEIARELGYPKPTIISMFKRGDAKVPLDKIPALAKAIHVDPAFLFRLALEQYLPAENDILNELIGYIASKNENDILEVIREATNNADPSLTEDLRKKIEAVFKSAP